MANVELPGRITGGHLAMARTLLINGTDETVSSGGRSAGFMLAPGGLSSLAAHEGGSETPRPLLPHVLDQAIEISNGIGLRMLLATGE